MSTTQNLLNLKIHKLSQDQYDNLPEKDPMALYLLPDDAPPMYTKVGSYEIPAGTEVPFENILHSLGFSTSSTEKASHFKGGYLALSSSSSSQLVRITSSVSTTPIEYYGLRSNVPQSGSTTASVIFPGILSTTVNIFTPVEGSGRIFAVQEDTEYSGYGDYDECVIDGVTVASDSYTTIKQEGGALDTVIYSAKFTDGTLYVRTTAKAVGTNSDTSKTLRADPNTTTATFTGAQLKLDFQVVTDPDPISLSEGIVSLGYDKKKSEASYRLIQQDPISTITAYLMSRKCTRESLSASNIKLTNPTSSKVAVVTLYEQAW